MRVVVTGATGLIGSRLVEALKERGDDVTALSRDPAKAAKSLGVSAEAWDPSGGPAPASALSGQAAVVNLAGENIAQRWSSPARAAIRETRIDGTRNLVAGLREAEPRPQVLVSASGVGYYGPRGDERVDESGAAGSDFLAKVCDDWEAEADEARALGMRVVRLRTGVVLAKGGGALAKMLPPFRAGVGGPVAGGEQWVPWVHIDDVVGMYLAALDDDRWTGPVNASAPEPVTNTALSKALGRALRRPAVMPVPAFALKLLYGEMSQVVTTGQRAVPARAEELGYEFRHTDLDEALGSALER
jgi:uncharacterized protein (TIGR01777 family)